MEIVPAVLIRLINKREKHDQVFYHENLTIINKMISLQQGMNKMILQCDVNVDSKLYRNA